VTTGAGPLAAQAASRASTMKRVVFVRLVFDIGLEDVEPVDFGGKPRGDGGARRVAGFGDLARRAGGVGGHYRLDAQFADHLAALAERVHMALNRLDVLECRALHRQQLVTYRHEMLGDDMQPGSGHQMMDVGDPAGDRILDRNHAEIGVARGEGKKTLLECSAGYGFRVRIGLADREGANSPPARPGKRSSS